MKKIFFTIFLLLFLISLTGCKSDIRQIREKKGDSTALEGIRKACDKTQSIVNMRIIPVCYLRGMLTHLQYTKQEALDYCMDNWNHCEEDIESAWRYLGGDYDVVCRQEVFDNKAYSEIGEHLKPCILDKLITNNKLTENEAVEYCKQNLTGGEGACEEKIKEINSYRNIYLK